MSFKEIQTKYNELVSQMKEDDCPITYTAIVKNKTGFGLEFALKPIDNQNIWAHFIKNNYITNENIKNLVYQNTISFKNRENIENNLNVSRSNIGILLDSSLNEISFSETVRPLKGGISIGSNGNTDKTGTLGCFFLMEGLQKYHFFLTCQHVMSYDNDITIQNNFQLHQPSSQDYKNINGKFGNQTIGATLETGVYNGKIDATIGFISENIKTSGGIYNLSNKLKPNPRNAAIGESVTKTGRTTGRTTGTILSINSSIKVLNPKYNKSNSEKKYLVFEDQIMTESMASPGDSGSALLGMDSSVLGLTFAKIDFNSLAKIQPYLCNIPSLFTGRTFHNKINNILSDQTLFKNYSFKSFI